MGKKSRSQRRKRGKDPSRSDDDNSTDGGDFDLLSDQHTIDGILSQGDFTLDSIGDEAGWDIHDGDDDAYHTILESLLEQTD